MARLSQQSSRGGGYGPRAQMEGRDAFLDQYGQILASSESRTSGASEIVLDLKPYQSLLTTGGTQGSEDVSLGDGTASADNAAAVIGQRKLVYLAVLGDTGDVAALDFANIVDTDGAALQAAELDAADEWVLVEWNGAAWQVVYHNATITPA